ncbi:MAG TPA: methyltransferase, partial [Candidatus Paceibacterota bacterium]|nr:methyltransferase [Candidatus Paceibacterota bacterium]
MSIPSAEDVKALIRDKYDGVESSALAGDIARLAAGEPLAYVIGWVPFLGLRIDLSSRPLIPRPETEYWTEVLIGELKKRRVPRVLDLCAGSGAIGLAVAKHVPGATVSFGELELAHTAQIRKNLELNGVGGTVRRGNLFAPFFDERFDVIATNPPYVPEGRTLEESVAAHEPPVALFAGPAGLSVIERIAR